MQPPDERFSTAEDLKSRTEHFAREEPMQAVGMAFAAGLVLTMLPVGAIVAMLLRLALSLLRPALMVLGAMKAYEEINRRQR
jgi:hypothetical protein